MGETNNITAETFLDYIFDKTGKYNGEFYYLGSAMARANRMNNKDNPNIEPIPFIIPSRSYSDPYVLGHKYRPAEISEEEWQRKNSPPNYIIDGFLTLGGGMDFNLATISWSEFQTGISISNCNFKERVNIQYFKAKSYIRFSNCTFTHGVDLRIIEAKEVAFYGCDFNSTSMSVFNCNIENLRYEGCSNISLDVNIDNKNFYSKDIVTNDIDHKIDSVVLYDLKNVIKLAFLGKNLGKINTKNIICDDAEFDVDINGIQIINELNDGDSTSLLSIKKFKAEIDDKNKSFISIMENLLIKNFSLTGTLKDSTLILIAVNFEDLKISNFINEGKFRLNDITLQAGGKGELIRSQLGKAEFNYVDFSAAQSFRICITNITEIIINNTKFSSNIIGKDKNDISGRREVYRQLKNAAYKQGDKIYELYYEKLEMIAYEKILERTNNWNDKIIFWTNKNSNDFGQNWTQAVSLLLIVSLYLFFAIKLTLTSMHFEHPPTLRHLAQFIAFTLNPLHKFSEIFYSYPKDINSSQLGFAEILDVVSRLFSGYMIFQFLRAFRKYTR